MSIEAMRLALEALESAKETIEWNDCASEYFPNKCNFWRTVDDCEAAITALRTAIEQAENDFERGVEAGKKRDPVIDKTMAVRIATQLGWEPKREWVSLTDDERVQLAVKTGAMSADWLIFMEAVEAKLKEKNT